VKLFVSFLLVLRIQSRVTRRIGRRPPFGYRKISALPPAASLGPYLVLQVDVSS